MGLGRAVSSLERRREIEKLIDKLEVGGTGCCYDAVDKAKVTLAPTSGSSACQTPE